jgi:hypothetical protein
MSKETSPRVIGSIIVFLGAFLIWLNWFYVRESGQFFALAAIIGPTVIGYGLSVIIRPPSKMPQTEFKLVHKVFAGIGFCLGLTYFLLLKFGI